MENPSLDETNPTRLPEEQDAGAQPGETLPVTIDEDEAEFANTVPIPTEIVPAEQPAPPPEAPVEASGLEQTAPTPVPPPPAEPPVVEQPPAAGRRSPSIRLVIFLGILVILVLGALSAVAGYYSGIQQRQLAEKGLMAQSIQEQFDLGLQDMQAGRYDLARQRFEYVIQLEPDFPGVTDKLADVLVLLNATATPTVFFTPTPSPTPDLRGVQELYTQAQAHLENSEWTLAIDTLLALRKADPTFQAVWVDNKLYLALRYRGMDKILKSCDLEGGIYDLSQSNLFGPLDRDADNYLTWASLYLTGASFWELDWSQAVYYFAQVGPALPNLCDGSGITAAERYRLALIGYGDFLAKGGDWCGARDQYTLALSLGPDTTVEEALTNATLGCEGAPEQPPAASTPGTPTPTLPLGVTPTETVPPPEATPTETPPVEPSPTP